MIHLAVPNYKKYKFFLSSNPHINPKHVKPIINDADLWGLETGAIFYYNNHEGDYKYEMLLECCRRKNDVVMIKVLL